MQLTNVLETPCDSPEAPSASLTYIWQDILAQAVTGELMAAHNYAALAGICDDPEEIEEAQEHAAGEQGHAAAFAAEGRKLGIQVQSNLEAKYWKRIRDSYMLCVAARDVTGCLIIQELMLESFAVASYERVGKVGPGSLGQTFTAIAKEEEGHIGHALSILQSDREKDIQAFDAKVYELHNQVMTTLAEMLVSQDENCKCQVCHGACVKKVLPQVSLSTAQLRGAALNRYLRTLDQLGLSGDMTLQWVSQLPA
jgi:fatty aldehyde decarbonylase